MVWAAGGADTGSGARSPGRRHFVAFDPIGSRLPYTAETSAGRKLNKRARGLGGLRRIARVLRSFAEIERTGSQQAQQTNGSTDTQGFKYHWNASYA